MAMKPRKVKAPVKKMRKGGLAKMQPMKKGGTDLATLRKMAKDKGYKLVKS